MSLQSRIFGNRLQKAKSKITTYTCTGYKEKLLQAFRVDVSSDAEGTHPTHFCKCCYVAMSRVMTATAKGTPYTTSVINYQWQEHSGDCRVCKSRQLLIQLKIVGYTHIHIHRFVNTFSQWPQGVAKAGRSGTIEDDLLAAHVPEF